MANACQRGKTGSTWRSGDRQVGSGSFGVHSMQQDVGKHRGKDVDDGYLEWIVNTFSESHPWWKTAADALTKRGKPKRQQLANRNIVQDLLSELKSCTMKRDLQKGRQVHTKAVETGVDSHMYVAAALINMYAKCGSMLDARTVFDCIHEPDVASWTALILGYAEGGQGLVALDLFSRMKDEHGCAPNSVTYIAVLKACTSLAAHADETRRKGCLQRGRVIHLEIGCHMNHFVQSTLIDMYAKCGSMLDARTVFDSIQEPDVASWNALILGYANDGQGLVALDLFSIMKDVSRYAPDSVTYVAVLKACTSLVAGGAETGMKECLERGRNIHLEIGCHINHFVQNTLIDMYAKSGSMTDAKTVFDSIQEPNVASWTALILGYAENGQGLVALDLFSRMKDERRCAPNAVTYIAALKACTSLAADADESMCLERCREIHSEIGCHLNNFVQSTLIDIYAKCGSMVDARIVFNGIQEPDLVSWNALILGYATNGQGLVALDLFSRMKVEHRCAPDSVTYVAALRACTSLAADGDETGKKRWLERGREIYSEIGCHINPFVQSTLIDLYAKCGSMVDARTVFEGIQEPSVVSWNALILGYVDIGKGIVALDLFSRMKDECRCAPSFVTYIAVLKASGSIGALAIGRRFHSEIREFDAHVVTCLVDFYAKCGSMEEAREVFDLHSRARVLPTWNALLAGYSSFGDTGSVFNLFEAMEEQGFQADAVTFVCMLSCCSHAGLVEKASEYLEVMPVRYGITPTVKHYTCMIDLLGRANKLDEAVAVFQEMPCDPDAVTWTTLLGACRKWKNSEIGRLAFESLVDLDQKNGSAYTLMAEIYGSRHMWEEQKRVLETRMQSGCLIEDKSKQLS